ncbi:MAG TPA: hypothetical protein VFQ53_22710 [Kofleriaceae bacterium]|nr:hypothetical protein [Kofleriaceae bacterium]
MAIQCANCRGYFSADEVVRCKPPRHPWQLTPAGEQAVLANQRRGVPTYPCPMCGHHALLA